MVCSNKLLAGNEELNKTTITVQKWRVGAVSLPHINSIFQLQFIRPECQIKLIYHTGLPRDRGITLLCPGISCFNGIATITATLLTTVT